MDMHDTGWKDICYDGEGDDGAGQAIGGWDDGFTFYPTGHGRARREYGPYGFGYGKVLRDRELGEYGCGTGVSLVGLNGNGYPPDSSGRGTRRCTGNGA